MAFFTLHDINSMKKKKSFTNSVFQFIIVAKKRYLQNNPCIYKWKWFFSLNYLYIRISKVRKINNFDSYILLFHIAIKNLIFFVDVLNIAFYFFAIFSRQKKKKKKFYGKKIKVIIIKSRVFILLLRETGKRF